MRRLAVMVLIMVGTMAPGRGTTAFFTSAASSASNVFSAGTVQLNDLSSASAIVTFSGMYPGATVYGTVTVQNEGSVALKYAVSTTVTATTGADNVANALLRDVRLLGAGQCTANGFSSLASLAPAETGRLANTAADANVVGNATDLTAAGARSLDPSGGATVSETLCMKVYMPTDSTGTGLDATQFNNAQSSTATIRFNFVAAQKSGL